MNVYVKKFTDLQKYANEVICYERLIFSNHVPNVVSKDNNNLILEIEYAGESILSLNSKNKKIFVNNRFDQLTQIIKDLRIANIYHLDLNIGNILINQTGHISIIDFEKVCIDGKPSKKLEKRYNKLLSLGGYKSIFNTCNNYLEMIEL